MTEVSELEALRAENAKLQKEATNLRTQLFFLREQAREIDDRLTPRRAHINDLGQHYCPRCRKCVFEPPTLAHYWKACDYTGKKPPEWCPACGQHLALVLNVRELPREHQQGSSKKST